MSIEFKYVPLTFISTRVAIETQLKNTIIFKKVIEKYNNCIQLGDLIQSTQYGFTASAKDSGNHKLLRITDINNGTVNWPSVPLCDCDREKTYLLSKGDVLIARTGNNISYLVEENVPENVVFASYLIRLVCNTSKLLPDYLFLFLNSYAFWPQILLKQRGALLQNVNANLMRQLMIPMCSIHEQKEIISRTKTDLVESINDEVDKILGLYNTKVDIGTELTHQLTLVKKLRQQLLQDAVQGKLVEQNKKDEPASELLKRIKEEKQTLIAEKKLKKEKELPPIKPDEIPFTIPENWVWCRLGEICTIKGGKRVANGYKLLKEPTPHIYIRVSDMKNGTVDDSDLHYLDESMFQKIKQYTISKDDIYMTIVGGTIGKCGLIPEKFHNMNLTENAAKINPILIEKVYLWKCLDSPFCQDQIIDKTKQVGVQKMALNRFSSSLIPIPPIAEQHRIVQKLDELMQYCNDLEASIKQSQQQNEKLLQQLLREALRGESVVN
jgi:type I restriction enzyme, S subunit